MERLKRRLPPLNGLAIFEAAARHLSFTLAAKEICITQAAVSRQIRLVEDFLGHDLFVREHRKVALTPAGQRLFAAVDQGFEHIAQTASDIRRGIKGALTISASNGFSTFWLLPRLEKFREEHPEVSIRLLSVDRDVDLIAERIDVAFTCGDEGQSQQVRMQRLFDENMVPLCSPQYLNGRSIASLDQLSSEKLIDLDPEHWRYFSWPIIDWPTWLTQMGYEGEIPASQFSYSNYAQHIQAIIDGKGVGLACMEMLSDFIAAGKLVMPLPFEQRTARGYYVAFNGGGESSGAMNTFESWLKLKNHI